MIRGNVRRALEALVGMEETRRIKMVARAENICIGIVCTFTSILVL